MHNQFKTQKFKHLMLAMGPRDLNSAPYSPVHCSSHSMTSFQSSELTELPVVENGQLFAQRPHSARYAPQDMSSRVGIGPKKMPSARPCASPPPPTDTCLQTVSPTLVGIQKDYVTPVRVRVPEAVTAGAPLGQTTCSPCRARASGAPPEG